MNQREFPSTHWSLFERLEQSDGPAHLNDFLGRYRPALVAFLQVQLGPRAADIEDIVQSFIVDKILRGKLLQQADAARGRLRHLLRTALRHYASNYFRDRRSQRRSPGTPLVSLSDLGPDAAKVQAADQRYEIEWARALLDQALQAAKAEAARKDLSDAWNLFVDRVIHPALLEEPVPSYDTLIAKYGLDSPAQASNRIITAKRMLQRQLRAVVSEYVTDPAAVEQELTELQAALGQKL